MFTNYLKTAFRNLLKNKGFSLINILGLSIALFCAQMLYIYVYNESTYDRFHKSADNIYRVATDFKFNDVLDHLALSAPPLGPVLLEEYPELEQMTQLTGYNQGKTLVKAGETKIYLENIFFADSHFFDVFTYQMLYGNVKQCLTKPNTVVITESTARLYFNSTDVLGKTLEFDLNDGTFAPYIVTGVVEDPPKNSHLKFTALTAMPGLWNIYPPDVKQNWVFAFMYTYIKLKPGSNYHSLQAKLKDLYKKKTADQEGGIKAHCDFILEPIQDIHLHSKRIWDVSAQGNATYINIFALTGLFILLLASINYINLSTAKAASRMKEMGIRKIVGANRMHLIMQVMMEVFIICLIAGVLAYVLSLLCVGFLSQLTGIEFQAKDLFSIKAILMLFSTTFGIALISGIYPGFYISRIAPLNAMKSSSSEVYQHSNWKLFNVRKMLVVFQFSISLIMIIATIVVYKQLHYMLDKDPGFDKESVVSVMLQDTLVASKFNALKGELMQAPFVQLVSFSASIPGGPPDRKITRVEGKTPTELVEIPTQPVFMDFDYPKLMGFQLKTGEFIKEDSGMGFRNAFLVNEAAVEKFAWKDPIGKRIVYGFNPQNTRDGKVVGVLKNVQTVSFKEVAEPMIFMVYKKPYAQTFVSIKMKGNNMEENLAALEKVFSKFDPSHPFDPIILDDGIKKLYISEERMSYLFTFFSFITLIIASMGLLGLVSFTIQKRTKEIGIRKVLGSSVSAIITLILKEFAVLIFIAFCIASPIAWYGMNEWLQDFANRIVLGPEVLLFSAFIILAIAFFTISIQIYKAAIVNPAKSLHYE